MATEDKPFYNVFDGTAGRPVGNYLDIRERREAEVLRAKAEGREPNLDEGSLPASTGTPFVVEANRVDNTLLSNPAAQGRERQVDPAAVLPVDVTPPVVEVDLTQAKQVEAEQKAATSSRKK